MYEDRMKNAFEDENRNVEFNNEMNDSYKTEKTEDAPEWNEELQKIVVGYH